MHDSELLQHLQTVTGQGEPLLAKILEEIQSWYTRDLSTWIRDRHRELQRHGFRNREIYPRLRDESQRILVHPGPLTERQIRRIIYG
ncbi:MAG: hypothetical protein KAY24_02705 [Candidatus Eisenbacteria sp.]|nr:hypothetical protein [Candidatus Eisenbacteria bacterium]